MTIASIWAMDELCGIGKDGDIPWDYPEDMIFFKETTRKATCIMGRITYESIFEKMGIKKSLLPGRECIVVTSNPDYVVHGAKTASSLADALAQATRDNIFIIGGARLYELGMDIVDELYITHIPGVYDCDVHLADIFKDKPPFAMSGCDNKESGLIFAKYSKVE